MRSLLLASSALVLSGAAFAQCPSSGYSVSGLPADGNSVAVSQSNGLTDILVWSEGQGGMATVSLGGAATIKVYDPTVSSTPMQALNPASSVQVALTDHPMIVEVNGGGVAAQCPASAITQMIGVNTHIAYGGTVYADMSIVLPAMAYLGIGFARDQAPDANLPIYQQMAAAGIKFDLITSPGGQDLTATLNPDVASIAGLAKSNPGSVLWVEAPNELNGNNVGGGQIVYLNGSPSYIPATGAAIVQTVSQAVRGNPVLSAQGVKVINVSINNGSAGWTDYVAGLGNLAAYVDVANWHVYFGGQPPASAIQSMFANAQQSAPGKPVMYTETGYYTSPGTSGTTTDAQQASMSLDLIMDALKMGVSKVILYELIDGDSGPNNQGTPNDPEDSYGAVYSDGTPKPSGVAIHNLVQILGGPVTTNNSTVTASASVAITPSAVGVAATVTTPVGTASVAAQAATSPATGTVAEENADFRWVGLPQSSDNTQTVAPTPAVVLPNLATPVGAVAVPQTPAPPLVESASAAASQASTTLPPATPQASPAPEPVPSHREHWHRRLEEREARQEQAQAAAEVPQGVPVAEPTDAAPPLPAPPSGLPTVTVGQELATLQGLQTAVQQAIADAQTQASKMQQDADLQKVLQDMGQLSAEGQ